MTGAGTGLAAGSLIGLVGNPNAGKTTVFNGLTGLRQKVGNYPGVTVERKEGVTYTQHGKALRLLDLPGSYSLYARSPDEQIAVDALLGRISGIPRPAGVICCVDGSNLERNLYLASQVIELGIPVILAVTMLDIAERRGIRVNLKDLGERLGVSVVRVDGNRSDGLTALRLAISHDWKVGRTGVVLPELVREAVQDLGQVLKGSEAGRPRELVEAESRLRLIAEEDTGESLMGGTGAEWTRIRIWRQKFDRKIPSWRSELIQQRYRWIGGVTREVVQRFNPNRKSWTERLDRWVLHPVGGFALLGILLVILFYSLFTLSGPFMDGIEAGAGWVGGLIEGWMPEGALRDLIVEGIIGGVGGILVFLPQILMLFFCIGLLESTGYMARAAFLLDRAMGKVGLHGKAFIPLLSSYACAVPGILSTRTIESPKDRLTTILVAPFMTCSARLPVYLIMIAALLEGVPHQAFWQAALLLGLYLLGTVTALVVAFFIRGGLIKGPKTSLVMELPAYRPPRLEAVLREMWERCWMFLKRAGTVILAFSVILWFLMTYPKSGNPPDGEEVLSPGGVQMETSAVTGSYAGTIGKWIEPVFSPLGFDWQITIGVLASFAAREVFVSTMAIVYHVEDEEEGLIQALREADRADGSPLFTPLTSLSILVFFVYALQCVSTVAVVRRETNSLGWAAFQFSFMFGFAWLSSFIVFQGGRLLGFQ